MSTEMSMESQSRVEGGYQSTIDVDVLSKHDPHFCPIIGYCHDRWRAHSWPW